MSRAAAQLPQLELFTVAEVADVMRVSRMTVYRVIREGGLPAVRFGRSYRVPADALQSYLGAYEPHKSSAVLRTAADGWSASDPS